MAGVKFPGKNRYKGLQLNVIRVTRGGGVNVNFPEEKRCVTLEWGAGGGVSDLLEKKDLRRFTVKCY